MRGDNLSLVLTRTKNEKNQIQNILNRFYKF